MKAAKLLLILALIGLLDSSYLTYEHYDASLSTCASGIFSSCNDVLTSSYSTIMGVPLALLGVLHYTILASSTLLFIKSRNRIFAQVIVLLSITGLLFSIYLVYLQAAVLSAYCIYCMISALTSFFVFTISWFSLYRYRKLLIVNVVRLIYKHMLKPVLFKIDPETIHDNFVSLGKLSGETVLLRNILAEGMSYKDSKLKQKLAGIEFSNPIGLAAGFDYNADLTQVLGSVGFGFHSVGTITNNSYEGNPKPRLGRLPKSRSLMVNKGFKNKGADQIIRNLSDKNFSVPLGISIGRTNSKKLMSQKQSVQDIVEAFTKFEKSSLNHSYYELNISCPNLYGNINFYSPKNLDELLKAIEKLKIKKPIFVKMPIEKSDKEVLQMLKVIEKYRIKGVVFGNLQKDRKHKTLDSSEVEQFTTGNFSGKPTYERSNELISLAYSHYKDRFIIVGCGGVFSAEDAYEKIRRGASLIQLITGMIFEGPQLIAKINIELLDLIEKDGYLNIEEARDASSL